MELKAIVLNCTLKKSPEISNTQALIDKVIEWFDALDVDSEVIRVVDFNVPEGVTSDEGEGDEWPQILAKIEAADIIVMSTHGRSGLRRAMYGSVADQVVRTATIPVLLVPPTAQYRMNSPCRIIVVLRNNGPSITPDSATSTW